MNGGGCRGFTLLEVLVALAIFASVAAAVLGASARTLNNVTHLENSLLAGWIADNRLTELQLAGNAPEPGLERTEVEFAGRRWRLESEVEATTDPGMRRVTLRVAADDDRQSPRERSLNVLSGFLEVRP